MHLVSYYIKMKIWLMFECSYLTTQNQLDLREQMKANK